MLDSRAQRAVVLLACFIPFTWFVLASRGAWLLDYGWQDNWSYLKYFNDWASRDPVLRDFLDNDYKGARVAWILPGFLVYQAFGPLAGNPVLNAAVAVVSILVTLGLTTRLFGLAAGAAATIVVSAYVGFYSSGYPQAWSYQGSICNVYYLLLLWALTEHARGTAPKRWALLAGVAGALTLLTGTNYVVALPWALVYWAVLRGKPGLPELIGAGALAVAGAVLTVGLLAAATVLAGGSPLFMLPLLQRSASIASGPSFGEPVATWLPRATWLAFPAIVLIGACATALALRARRELACPHARAFVAAFVGFAGLWLTMIALEATIQAYVQYEHYNYMVVGPAALALGGVLRWLPRGASRAMPRRPLVVYPLLAALVVLPQVLLDPALVSAASAPVTQVVRAWSLPGAAILSLLAGSVGLAFVAGGAWRPLLPAGLLFGTAFAFANPTSAPLHMAPACQREQDNFLLVNDVTRWMASERWHVNTRAWFPARDVLPATDGCGDVDLYWTFLAIEQAGMLWKITTPLPEAIAGLDQRNVRNIAEKQRAHLVMLSQPGMADTYNRELTTWGRTSGVNPVPRPAEKRTFTRGSLSMTVQVYRLR